MTPAQALKMAEQQLVFWKAVAAVAKAQIKERERAKGKKLRPARKVRPAKTSRTAAKHAKKVARAR
jgi:hypothetical protein